MPTPIAYPSTLPMPQAAPIQSAERRALAPEGGPYDVRALQRDRLAVQRVVFPAFSPEEMAIFWDWYEDDIESGGSWFAATWPLPQGTIEAARRFLAPFHAEFIPSPKGNYWRVTADFEVRGRGVMPLLEPMLILGMHFDGDETDETGHAVTVHEDQPGSPNPTYPTDTPKFGSAYYLGVEQDNVLVSDDRGSLALNRTGAWQIVVWLKPEPASIGWNGGGILSLVHGGADGVDIDGGATTTQLVIQTTRPGGDETKAQLQVDYLVEDAGGGVPGVWTLAPIGDDTENAMIPCDGEWHSLIVGGDSTSTRAYIDGVLAMDDHKTATGALPGEHPLMVMAYTHQRFVVGANFSGFAHNDLVDPDDFLLGVPPATDYNIILSHNWTGAMDDLAVYQGSFEYTGETVSPPAGPF